MALYGLFLEKYEEMLFFISIFLPPLPILKFGSTQANESATKILKPTKIYVRKQRRKYTHFNCHVVSPTRLKEKLVLKFLFRFFQFVFFFPLQLSTSPIFHLFSDKKEITNEYMTVQIREPLDYSLKMKKNVYILFFFSPFHKRKASWSTSAKQNKNVITNVFHFVIILQKI